MSTKRFTVDDSGYVLIATQDSKIRNDSSYIVRIVFSEDTPNINTIEFHPLRPNDYITKEYDLPKGNVYALCENKNQRAVISVSDGSIDMNIDKELDERILRELRLLRIITGETFQTTIDENDIGINSHEN